MGARSLRLSPWGRRAPGVGAAVLILGVGVFPSTLPGQEPDSLVVPVEPDSTMVADSLLQTADTVSDSLRVVHFPTLAAPAGRRPARAGVWAWGREDLLWAPGLSLSDLLREVPGLRIVRAGDYGGPHVAAAFGLTAGRVRVFLDGIELIPLEGGVVDLSLVGLAGLEHVRVERSPGGIDIELESRRDTDPRPYTQIEAGTGDLETNFFRGTFSMPRAPGGSLLLTIDRIDTNGRANEDPGTLNGVLARYALSPSDRLGAEITLLKRSTQRSLYAPLERDRRDWLGRIRAVPTPSMALGVFAATSESTSADSLLSTTHIRQIGAEAGWSGTNGAARASVRRLDGDGIPNWFTQGSFTLESARAGGVSAAVRQESWDGASARRIRAGAWTVPLAGFSLFAETDRGDAAIPARSWENVTDSAFTGFAERPRGVDHRTTVRWGAAFERWGLMLRGARVQVEADSIYRYDLPFDVGTGAVEGGMRSAWEAQAAVPLLVLDGLSAVGNAVLWDDETPWPYTPRFQYDARVRFHNRFLPTENFELLVDVGVQEREAMALFGPPDSLSAGPTTTDVRFHQSWFARLHMRIVSLQLFVHWENLTTRQENQDIPDRLLPRTRTYYGVRWGLWN